MLYATWTPRGSQGLGSWRRRQHSAFPYEEIRFSPTNDRIFSTPYESNYQISWRPTSRTTNWWSWTVAHFLISRISQKKNTRMQAKSRDFVQKKISFIEGILFLSFLQRLMKSAAHEIMQYAIAVREKLFLLTHRPTPTTYRYKKIRIVFFNVETHL